MEGSNFVKEDSVTALVTSTREVDNATFEVVAETDHLGTVTMTIKDRKTLTSVSINASKATPFTLEIYDTPGSSILGECNGPIICASGPSNGTMAYPDVSGLIFTGDIGTTYKRNGVVVPATNTPQSPKPEDGPLAVAYKRVGAFIFMTGLNESGPYLIPYVGVLLPGNKKMYVHSDVIGCRLPNYSQTIAWYGPIGQTPYIER